MGNNNNLHIRVNEKFWEELELIRCQMENDAEMKITYSDVIRVIVRMTADNIRKINKSFDNSRK
jgi:hypothetical protein